MNNPRVIETVVEGATYKVPTYKVTNAGIEDGSGIEIVFCKGNKELAKFVAGQLISGQVNKLTGLQVYKSIQATNY